MFTMHSKWDLLNKEYIMQKESGRVYPTFFSLILQFAQATDLDEIIKAHSLYIEKILERCLITIKVNAKRMFSWYDRKI